MSNEITLKGNHEYGAPLGGPLEHLELRKFHCSEYPGDITVSLRNKNEVKNTKYFTVYYRNNFRCKRGSACLQIYVVLDFSITDSVLADMSCFEICMTASLLQTCFIEMTKVGKANRFQVEIKPSHTVTKL